MRDRKQIENIAIEALKETEIFLVDIIVSRSNVIQVFIDHNNGVSLDDCAGLHRRMDEMLDREAEDFELQVSSPGLGQAIKVFAQYIKAVGQKLEIVLEEGDILKGILLEAIPGDAEKAGQLTVRQVGTKRKPAPEDPIIIEINRIKTARVEIDFKQL